MMRIRYRYISSNLESTQPIVTDGKLYKAIIDPVDFDIALVDIDSLKMIELGRAENLSEAKKLIKNKLIEMGANFSLELRNRKKDEV